MREQTRQENRTEVRVDRIALTVATVASVLGAMLTSALGSGFLAPLMAAAVVPALTAFLVHPGPYRRRRITAVLTRVMWTASRATPCLRCSSYRCHHAHDDLVQRCRR